MAGDFTVSATNQVPLTRLGVGQAQEHVNKELKGQGAVNGITQSPSTLQKFCLRVPDLARISGEIEISYNYLSTGRSSDVIPCVRQHWNVKRKL